MILIQGTALVDGALTGGLGEDVLFRNKIEQAWLTGGEAANLLDASAFNGNVTLRGLGGNDTLLGGAQYDILVGGDGDDQLSGGGSRDLLFGGLGLDLLDGGAEQDLLIGGDTRIDDDREALAAVLREWSRTDVGYSRRISNLLGTTPGSLSGTVRLHATTVFNDGLENRLTGGASQDWFFQGVADLLPDVLLAGAAKETVTVVS